MTSMELPLQGPARSRINQEADVVIVAGYMHSGIALFRKALESANGPVWIDAPGLVHVTYQLCNLWQRVDGRVSSMSGMSTVSRKGIRSLLQSMLIGRLAEEGSRAWVTATLPSPHEALKSFAEICTEAKFVCLHRRYDDFVTSAMTANQWGIASNGSGFEKFAMQHPWNPVAALTQYWAVHTEALFEFQRNYPDRCLQVHYADLLRHAGRVMGRVSEFTRWELRSWPPGQLNDGGLDLDSAGDTMPIPRERIPAELLDKVNHLTAELGY